MKKIFLFVAVVSAFSLASCKKDRTCTCTQSSSAGGATTTDVTVYTDAKKSDAKKACISGYTEYSGVKYTQDCKLD